MASPTLSPMTSGRGPTSFRKSWTEDTWNSVKRKWNSRARCRLHDREYFHFSNRTADRANAASKPGTATRCLAEESKDLRLPGRGIAGDCGGVFQLVRQKNARTASRRYRATTTASFARQHRQ